MTIVYYRVEIANSGLNTTTPSDGFIDPKAGEFYTSLPSTKAASLAKERANLRWLEITQCLAENTSPLTSNNFDTDATNDVAGSYFNFTVSYDKPNSIYTYDDVSGDTLWNEDCIKRQVARALIHEIHTNTYVSGTPVDSGEDVDNSGIQNIVVGKLADDLTIAEAAITVTQIVV